MDTMIFWMDIAMDDLKKTISMVDVLIINDEEARQLSGEYSLKKASKVIRAMGPKYLIIKKGEHGALLFNEEKVFYAPALPLEEVFDPTGAGDTFAGGFIGYLASTNDISFDNMRRAIIAGSALAAGLEANQVSAQSLADFGVTKPQSQIGYQKIAYQKPRGEFLTAISPEEGIKYTQGLAEDIEFKKDAKAIKQQEMLIEKEKARLSGQSGIARGALSSPKAF
jgi:bifunctional ADP-heptose synthase (sugar kinase/adenylyltransferase)